MYCVPLHVFMSGSMIKYLYTRIIDLQPTASHIARARACMASHWYARAQNLRTVDEILVYMIMRQCLEINAHSCHTRHEVIDYFWISFIQNQTKNWNCNKFSFQHFYLSYKDSLNLKQWNFNNEIAEILVIIFHMKISRIITDLVKSALLLVGKTDFKGPNQ